MSLTINGLDASSMRVLVPWSGVWSADVDVEADIAPAGKAVIASTTGIALVGTVEPARSGTFGQKRHAHVIAGGGGWGKKVRAQHFQSDAGVTLTVLASATAAEAGEVVTVLVPKIVGLDFPRLALPASQIFTDAGVDWWVGFDGVTRVGIRPPAVQSPELAILDWDPAAGTMTFTSPTIPEPGTVLVDERFGKRIVRAVEATVAGGSVSGTVWVADAPPKLDELGTVDELVDNLAALAREATRAELGRFYEYRVIDMAGERVLLQAVTKADGVPDLLPASVWAGISGYKAKLRPASKCLVGFIAGRVPYVAAYEPPEADGWRPVELEIDALAALKIGEQAAAVVLGGEAGALPIARAPAIVQFFVDFQTAMTNAATAASAIPDPLTPAQCATIFGAVATEIATAYAELERACPSAKVRAS